MLSIYKNDYYKIIISFLLIFLILFNFGSNVYIQKVQAEAILLGIGIKLVATILASMGVLTFVNSQTGGVSGFVDGLVDHMEKVQGVTNALGFIVQLGKDIIINKVKLGASSLVQNVSSFYDFWSEKFKKPDIVDESLVNITARSFLTYSSLATDYQEMLKDMDYIHLTGDVYYKFYMTIAKFTELRIDLFRKVNDDFVSINRYWNYDSGILGSHTARFSTLIEYSDIDKVLYFTKSFYNYNKNELFEKTTSHPIDFNVPGDIINDESYASVPSATNVSNNLEWGWQITDSVGGMIDSLGKTTAEVFESANSAVDDFVSALEKVGSKVNDIKAGEIVVENDVVVDVVYPDLTDIFDKVNEGIGENTGILTGILTGITGIFDWLKELFVIDPNYIMTKIETLQGLINDKVGLPSMSPLTGLFGSINGIPIPSNKYVNTDFINSLASTVRDWQRFFWYVILMLFGANKVYKLVRKDDLIKFRNSD